MMTGDLGRMPKPHWKYVELKPVLIPPFWEIKLCLPTLNSGMLLLYKHTLESSIHSESS